MEKKLQGRIQESKDRSAWMKAPPAEFVQVRATVLYWGKRDFHVNVSIAGRSDEG